MQHPLRKISLRPEEEVVGFYKKLLTTTNNIVVALQSSNGKDMEVSFPIESKEAEIVRKSFRFIGIGEKVGILRIANESNPISVRKVRQVSSKKGTFYIDKKLYAKLEKYQEPGKSIVTAIQKVLDIAENRETVVAVINQGVINCNKMKHLPEPNRVYCKMLETMVSKEYCIRKCIIAPQIEELSKNIERPKTKTAPLENFLLTPKIEHLRNPPKIQKDRNDFV